MGKVQTNEEAQVYVHDLGPFVNVQLLEDPPAVLSLGKTLRRTRIFLVVWVSGQKTTVDHTGEENYMHNGHFRTSCCSRVVVQFGYKFVFNIDIAGPVFIRSSLRSL